jgi:hypothetical protein
MLVDVAENIILHSTKYRFGVISVNMKYPIIKYVCG